MKITLPYPAQIAPGVCKIVLLLALWRTSILLFHRGHTNLHTHQWCMSVPFCLYLCTGLLLCVLLMISTAVRWNLSVVLICILFIAKYVEHFFRDLLDISTSSFENYLFSSLASLFSELLILCGVSFLSYLYILVINPFSDIQPARIFYHSVRCLFRLGTIFFAV
jgi:hypothetical protein